MFLLFIFFHFNSTTSWTLLYSFFLHSSLWGKPKELRQIPTTAVWFTNLFLYFGSFNFISLSLFPLIFCPSFSHYKRTTFYSFGVLLNSKGKHEKWIPRIELWLQKVQIIGLWIKTWRKHWVRSFITVRMLSERREGNKKNVMNEQWVREESVHSSLHSLFLSSLFKLIRNRTIVSLSTWQELVCVLFLSLMFNCNGTEGTVVKARIKLSERKKRTWGMSSEWERRNERRVSGWLCSLFSFPCL